MDQVKEIVGKIVVVQCDIRTISGAVSRNESEKEDAFTAGQVKYIAPTALKSFLAVRQNAIRACLEYGTRFLGGYAVPEENVADLMSKLGELGTKYNEDKRKLVLNFEQEKAEWLALHPEIAEYQSRFPTAGWVGNRLVFGIGAYKITPGQEIKLPDSADDSLLSSLAELPRQVLKEIAHDVSTSWKPNGNKASRVHGLLQRIQNKIATLQFLGGDLQIVGNMVQATIERLPKSGTIEGADFSVLWTLLTTLSDPERALEMAQRFAAQGAGLFDDEQEAAAPEAAAPEAAAPEAAVPEAAVPEAAAPEAAVPEAAAPEAAVPEAAAVPQDNGSSWAW